MSDRIDCFVFDGFADWEPALALCGLHQEAGYEVRTFGLTGEPVVSQGGLRVVPDISVDRVVPEEAALLLLPGGTLWEEETPRSIQAMLPARERAGAPIAAICGATLALARAGLLAGRRHTSNALAYLMGYVPEYPGHDLYLETLAVTDRHVVTASGAGHVEFAREIFRLLEVYDDDSLRAWYDLFKHGILPSAEEETEES